MKSIKRTLNGLLILGLVAVFTAGCNKYDEGGLVKKADKRLTVNSWQLEKYLRNGNDETTSLLISNFQEQFQEGGALIRNYIGKDGSPFSETGIWQFDNDKQQIKISGVSSVELTDETSTVSSSDYNILKLKKGELWYYFDNGGDRHEFHFVPN